jgi:transcriptional regulator with XRE-family HTH domain
MDQQTVIADMEARAEAAKVSIRQVCVKAGVHPTTFSRWKQSEKNPEPIGATLQSLGKLDAALRQFEATSGVAA